MSKTIWSGAEVVGTMGVEAARRGGSMGIIVSRLTGGECGAGGCRGGVYCIEASVSRAMVSGAIVLVSIVSRLSCRGLGGWGGCCEVRGDVKNMMDSSFGGGNGRYCGPTGHKDWIVRGCVTKHCGTAKCWVGL